MTTSAILVVGGYGAVGATVTRQLAACFPGRVHAGGRDLERARRLAVDVPDGAVRPVRVDVADVAAFARVLEEERVGTVVLCVEPPDAALAAACLARGVHLVDVGASAGLLAQVEALDGSIDATAVLSVGLAPGLTNLLARRAHDRLGGAERLDISVLLGAGEHHGVDAVRWTVAGLAAQRPPAGPLRVPLPGYGTRTVHPFPFSDQHTLRRTLGVAEATTRLCLDSRPLTAALFGLQRIGAFRAARRPAVEHAMTAVLHRAHLGGSDGWAVRVDAARGDRRVAFAVTGRDQSRTTGLVAAHVTRALLTAGFPPGVHHIEELPGLDSLPEDIADSVQ